MSKPTLLIVEDDADIQEMLSFALSSQGYALIPVQNVRDAWQSLQQNRIDLVLLDWMLPDRSGIELLQRIRKHHSLLPVIMLTARAEESERVLGLDTGADDYITKPFSVRELQSRIRALLRRSRPDSHVVRHGRLSLDPESHRVEVDGTELALSPTEFRLLQHFMTHTERVYSRAQLLDRVWGQQRYVEERTVDVHVRRLRKQLQPYGLDGLLQTVHGSGYRFSRPVT